MSQAIVVFSYDVACDMAKDGKWSEVLVGGGGERWSGKTMGEAIEQMNWERPGMLCESFEFRY
jgi:hypothetical protein